MDLWSWVSSKEEELSDRGESRLAKIMSDISSFTCDDRHDKVDQIFPEGLALARKLDEKWVELFLRHWYLQSQVLHRQNAKGMLNEAIDLLDFSHKEDTVECPQRICAVQDLANCYGIQDGPGFVEERIEVAKESLGNINGSWPCYQCIGSELADALFDGQRYEEALTEIEKMERETEAYNEGHKSSGYSRIKTRVMMKLGRLDEAEEIISKAFNDGGGDSFERSRTLILSLVYATKGDTEKALENCLGFDEVLLSQSYYVDWCEINFLAVKQNALQVDNLLLERFRNLAHQLTLHGSFRNALNVNFMLAEIAIENDRVYSAKTALSEISKLVPQLNKDLGASDREKSLTPLISEMQNKLNINLDAFEDVKSFLDEEFDDDEIKFFAYEEALKKWPDSPLLVVELSQIYEDFSQFDLGLKVLKEIYLKDKSNDYIQFYYGNYLLSHFGEESYFQEFGGVEIDHLPTEEKLNICWLNAKAYYNSDREKSCQYLEACVELKPESKQILKRLANTYFSCEDYSGALEAWNKMIYLEPEEHNHHWDRMVVATLLERWDLVRESAATVDMKIEDGEGPIALEMEDIRVQFEGSNGDTQILWAKRTGPVTARVEGIAHIADEQRYKHEIVFDPVPLNVLDQEDDDGYKCDSEGYYSYLYPVAKTVKSPEYFIFTIDGVHPGEEVINSLEKSLANIGAVLSLRSSEEYQIYFEPNDEDPVELLGCYAYILVPSSENFRDVHHKLDSELSLLEHPLIWPALLEEIEDYETLEKHNEIEQRYDL